MQLRFVERWISSVRLIALPFVVGAVALAAYPPGRWETWAWVTTFAVLMALIAGWLVHRLSEERAKAEARAEEAERLHEAERRTVEELRRISQLRADFVALVSHEVRTPLAAVIGASTSPGRSPRRTAARSTWCPSPARAPPSRSTCRRGSAGLAEPPLELARALGHERAQLGRGEHDRLAAEREHLADEPVGAADRPLRERGAVDERAARPSRPPSGRRRASTRCGRSSPRAAPTGRSPRGARIPPSAASPCASGRAGSSGARRGRRPRCGRTSAAAAARSRTARSCASRPRSTRASGTRARRAACGRCARVSVATRSSSAPACGVGVWARSNWPNASSSFARTRSSGELEPAAIIGPTNSSASRIARASSGVRRGARRKVSPKSSLSTCTSSPCSSA